MAAPPDGSSPSAGTNAGVNLRNVTCADSTLWVAIGDYDAVSGLQQGPIRFSAICVVWCPTLHRHRS